MEKLTPNFTIMETNRKPRPPEEERSREDGPPLTSQWEARAEQGGSRRLQWRGERRSAPDPAALQPA